MAADNDVEGFSCEALRDLVSLMEMEQKPREDVTPSSVHRCWCWLLLCLCNVWYVLDGNIQKHGYALIQYDFLHVGYTFPLCTFCHPSYNWLISCLLNALCCQWNWGWFVCVCLKRNKSSCPSFPFYTNDWLLCIKVSGNSSSGVCSFLFCFRLHSRPCHTTQTGG